MRRLAWVVALGFLVASGCSEDSGEPQPGPSRLDPLALPARTDPPRRAPPPREEPVDDRARFETPPGFSPWRPGKPARSRGEDRELLVLALETLEGLPRPDRIQRTAQVVESLGPAAPDLAWAALERSEAMMEEVPEGDRWPLWASLARAAVALLPEAGGPLLERILQRRSAEALGPGEGDVPLALMAVLEPFRAELQERIKLASHILSQVGRIRRHESRREVLVALAAGTVHLGGEVGAILLDQILQRAPLALQPDDRIPVRLAVARALGELGAAREPLDRDLLLRLVGEAAELDAAEDRYRYLDSLALAAGGLPGADAAAVLDKAASEAARIHLPRYRRWALQTLLVARCRLAAIEAERLESVRAAIEAAGGDPGHRVLAADVLAAGQPAAAASLLLEALGEASEGDREHAAKSARVAIRLGPAAAAYWSKVKERVEAAPEVERPPIVFVGLARAFPGESGAWLARAVEASPAAEDPGLELREIARAARDLAPGAAGRVLEPLSRAASDDPDPGRGSRLAEAHARALAWIAAAGAREAFLVAVRRAAELPDPGVSRGRLAELASSALDLEPRDAEAGLLAVLAAAPEGGSIDEALVVPLWAADALARLGSPALGRALESVLARLASGPAPGPLALNNLARLLSIAGGSVAADGGRLLDRWIDSLGVALEPRLAIATGYLAGNAAAAGGRIESALRALSTLPDGGVSVAGGLGEVAGRLEGRPLLALARAIESPEARLAFLRAAGGATN